MGLIGVAQRERITSSGARLGNVDLKRGRSVDRWLYVVISVEGPWRNAGSHLISSGTVFEWFFEHATRLREPASSLVFFCQPLLHGTAR